MSPTATPADPVAVRAATVLPARREDVELVTDDGLVLVGELALPAEREPVATLVCLHPLPTAGGSMDSHVLRKAARRLPALADLAVLRFNTRGTTSARGTSGGAFDAGRAERADVAAALALVAERSLPHPWLLGWSFGTDLALVHGLDAAAAAGPGGIALEGAILLSPPLRWSTEADLARWATSGLPVLALVPELDDFLRPDAARERFAAVPQAEVVGASGAKHLWVGEKAVGRALDEVVARVAPSRSPLPTTWAGDYEVADDLRPAAS